MSKISLIIYFLLLFASLMGCQQNSEEQPNNLLNGKKKYSETNEVYDIEGIVTEINVEHKRVLLQLTQKVQKDESEMWIEVFQDTTNKKEKMKSFNNLKPGVQLKANLTDECLESNPRICFAQEIVIEN
ncbi:hypothetical protein [Bacillus pinisoli]|uniref:hypothetical protein n=1 Tax=Bacillus pinisoli TaxID=2901866 RepID=UPI001FF2DD5E|nr:hypothetical protein [Bacillus pinisoli]